MTSVKLFLGSFLLMASFSFIACKKESTNPDNKGIKGYVVPPSAKDTLIKIPDQMIAKANNDFNLAIGVIEIDQVNSLSAGLSSGFIYDQNAMNGWTSSNNSDGSTSYSWDLLPYKAKVTYYHSGNESWWKYEEDSASYSYPYYYIDDKGTSGEKDWYGQANFKSPQFTVYKEVWSKSGGATNSTFNWYNEDGTAITTQYVSTSNADKSGALTVNGQNNNSGPLVKQWYYVWNSNGSGSYTNYKSDGITVNLTGTF